MANTTCWRTVEPSLTEGSTMISEDKQTLANVGVLVAFGVAVMLGLIIVAYIIG
jgi:hypothetical protein